jgi:hypothetical protein
MNGWSGDSKGVTGKQTRKREKKRKTRLRWMDNVKFNLMNVGVELWRKRALEKIE